MIYQKNKVTAFPDIDIDESKAYYPYFEGYNERQNDIAYVDDDYSDSIFDETNSIDVFDDFFFNEVTERQLSQVAKACIDELFQFPDKWFYNTAKKRYSYCKDNRDVEIFIMNVCYYHHINFPRLLEKMDREIEIQNYLESHKNQLSLF